MCSFSPYIFSNPYIDQIFENSKLVVEKLGLRSEQYTNTWQSESNIGILWIKPDVLEYFGDHLDHYIFVAIRFISEHIEVLFDNDMKCYESCQECGVNYYCSRMPNTDSRLIDALISTVRANEHQKFKKFLPEEETFDELVPSDETKNILSESQDLQIPEFVKKLIEKKVVKMLKLFENLFKPRQRRLTVYMLLTSSVLSTTSKRYFDQPAASFLVCSLIFIEYKMTILLRKGLKSR